MPGGKIQRRALLLCALFVSVLESAASGAAPAAPPIRVLILDGFSNHDWQLTTRYIRAILQPTKLFAVDVSTAPPDATSPGWNDWRPDFTAYDVVIQNCNDINGGPSWPAPVRDAFERFVRRGGGVFAWHSANNAFASWDAYNEMIGLGWRPREYGWSLFVDDDARIRRVPPGQGEGTGHGKRFDARIVRRGQHSIHRGLPSEWLAADTEVYYFARGPAKHLKILSYARDPKTGLNWPTEWTVRYGRGRVYTSTFGHVWRGDIEPESVRDVAVQTLLIRALQWLAKSSPNWPVPADFPTAFHKSVREKLLVSDQ